MEYKLAFVFGIFVVIMMVISICSVGSYDSNQPQDRALILLDSINKQLEYEIQERKHILAKNDSILKDLEAGNAKLRKMNLRIETEIKILSK